MIHILLGWALIALGLADIVLVVRVWFSGNVYLPWSNLSAGALGVAAVVFGGLLIFGWQLAFGTIFLIAGLLGAIIAYADHRWGNLDDTTQPTPPLWHAYIGLAIAVVGALILLF